MPLMVLLMVVLTVLTGSPAVDNRLVAVAKDHFLAAAANDRLLDVWMQYLSLTPSMGSVESAMLSSTSARPYHEVVGSPGQDLHPPGIAQQQRFDEGL